MLSYSTVLFYLVWTDKLLVSHGVTHINTEKKAVFMYELYFICKYITKNLLVKNQKSTSRHTAPISLLIWSNYRSHPLVQSAGRKTYYFPTIWWVSEIICLISYTEKCNHAQIEKGGKWPYPVHILFRDRMQINHCECPFIKCFT